MSVQNIQGYTVLVNDQPAVINNTLFNNCFYTEFDTALNYVKKWLGFQAEKLPKFWQGDVFTFHAGGKWNFIEIKFSSGIEL